MIDLYHHGSFVCAAKVRFAFGEKNLAWQGHYLDVVKGDQFAPEYQKLNREAVVPTLVHDGNVTVKEKKTVPPRALGRKRRRNELATPKRFRRRTRHPRS
jgi:glutathione S-transferase-like protein